MKEKIGFGLVWVGIAVYFANAFVFPLLGPDSGYYLAMMRDFYSGKSYFTEIATIYNPLSQLWFGLPFTVSTHPDPRLSLLFNVLVFVGSSLLLYRLLRCINTTSPFSLFLSLFFFLLNLFFDGSHILLEPLSVFFLLLATLCYLKASSFKDFFTIGVLISFSFLSKQYGLFFVAPLCIDIFFIQKKHRIKRLLVLGVGFLVPILVFLFYLYKHGASITQGMYYMLGKGVPIDVGNGTGNSYDFFSYSIGIVVFLFVSNYGLTMLRHPRFTLSVIRTKPFFALLFIFSVSVLINASYLHYFQYIIPFSLLFYAQVQNEVEKQQLPHTKSYSFLISLVFLTGAGIYSLTKKPLKFQNQETERQAILSAIPRGSAVFLEGVSPAYYYLCDFNSINLSTVGYTFSGYFLPNSILKYAKGGSFILANQEQFQKYKPILDSRYTYKTIMLQNQVYYLITVNFGV